MEPKGLGDKIENFTKATGIKSAVDGISRATGVPGGCIKRKSILNKMFPWDELQKITENDAPVYSSILALLKIVSRILSPGIENNLQHSDADILGMVVLAFRGSKHFCESKHLLAIISQGPIPDLI